MERSAEDMISGITESMRQYAIENSHYIVCSSRTGKTYSIPSEIFSHPEMKKNLPLEFVANVVLGKNRQRKLGIKLIKNEKISKQIQEELSKLLKNTAVELTDDNPDYDELTDSEHFVDDKEELMCFISKFKDYLRENRMPGLAMRVIDDPHYYDFQ